MAASARIALPQSAASAAGVARWFLPLAAAATAVGALATISPVYAVMFAVAIGLVVLVAANVSALTVFLIVTMFLESLALGPGLRIGRLAGVVAVVVLLFWMLANGTAGLRASPLLLLGGAYGLWMVVSGLWATSGSYVATYLTHWALSASYMLAFAVLVRTRKIVFLVFATLAVGALVVGMFSFIGYLSHGSQYLASGRGATGLQGDHNYFAVYQAIALPATLTLAALERRRVLRMLYTTAVIVIALSVVASLSRTGLFALVGVVLVTLLVPSRFFFRRRAQKLSYLGALLIASAVVGLAGSSPFLTRVQSIWQSPGGVAGHAGSGRIDLWRAAWHGYTQHPVLGLGAGNFQAHSIELLQQTPGADTSAAYALKNFVVHNMYLETLTDLGPVGLLILLGMITLTGWVFLRTFRRARRAGDRPVELFSVALFVSLIAYCIGGFFLSIEFNKPLWILVGLALAFDVMARADGADGEQVGPAVPALAGAGTGAGMPPPPVPEPPRRRENETRDTAAAAPEADLALLAAERARLDRLRTLLAVREARLQEREAGHSLEGEAAALDAKARELDATAARLSEEQANLEARLAEVERREAESAQVAELRSELETRLADVLAREGRAAKLPDLDARAAELAQRERVVAAQSAEHSALRADVEARLAQLEALETQAIDLQNQLEQRELELTAERAQVDAANAALSERLREREEQDAALRSELERAAALRTDVEERLTQLEAREAAVASERARVDAAHAVHAAAAARLDSRTSELDELETRLRSRISELDEREARLAAELDRVGSTHERALALSEEVERRVESRRADLERREAEAEAAIERADALRAAAEESGAQAAAALAAVEEREATLAAAQRDVEAKLAAFDAREERFASAQSELEARLASLEEREGELQSRLASIEQRAAEIEQIKAAHAARAEHLRDQGRALEEREQQLERDRAIVADILAKVERRDAELQERERVLAEPVPALVAQPEPVHLPVAPPPQPTPAAAAAARVAAAPPAATPNLIALEALVAERGRQFPEQLDEWGYYLLYLRDFADVDGRLGESFEPLVWEVFGPLLER